MAEANRADGLRTGVALNNGVRMPWLGLGVFKISGDAATESAVRQAIELGYRSIDTAAAYGNERGVGRAVAGCGVPREELFITTKAWNDDVRRDRVEEACDESLRRLGLEYVDLYLIHWPVADRIVPAWKAAERIHRRGQAKAIGVSNHLIPHLDQLLPKAEVVPAVNQVEYHPYLQSKPLHEYCRARGIRLEAWSPLMRAGAVFRDPAITMIARKHGKTPAQVILRWDLQNGVVTIPKSARPERIAENGDVFDFALDESEMDAIAKLDRGARNGPDPMNFGF